MKGFRFKLAAVLKHRQHRRDLCRQILAQLLADDQRLESQRSDVERDYQRTLDEIRSGGQAGPIQIEATAQRRFYGGRLRLRMAELSQHKQLLMDQIRMCRSALVRAEKDLKTLQQLESKQLAQFIYEQQKHERLEVEDMWMARRIQEAAP